MEDHHSDRMATPRKRGRPPKYGIGDDLAPATPGMPQPVEAVPVHQPALTGMRCPKCGRGMIPRRDRVQPDGCYASCRLCGARLAIMFDGERVSQVRLVR